MTQSAQIRIAALILFLAVLLGALGAHPLKSQLIAQGHLAEWKTAVLYHLVHGLALFVLALHSTGKPRMAFWGLLTGIVLFSGSLYVLSLTGISKLGAITPLGGLFFLASWGSFLIFPFQKNK